METNISLRRSHKTSVHKNDNLWLSKKMKELYEMLKDIHYKPIDSDIEQIIIKNEELANCKTLDAIHIATALYFKKNSRELNIVLCSFDKNMLDLAKRLGLDVSS